MANNKLAFTFPMLFITLQSCISTNGMDYYSKEAYAERGAFNQDIEAPQYKIPDSSTSQMAQSQQNFQMQQQTYALNNTANYSSNVADSRSVNQVDKSYGIYLSSLSAQYQKYASYLISKGLSLDAKLLDAKAQSAAQGYDVVFETEESFNIPLDKKGIIAKNRKDLENVKSNIALLQAMPTEVAVMQSSFDCMVLEARNRMYSHGNVCGIDYRNSFGAIQKNSKNISSVSSFASIASESVDASFDNGGSTQEVIDARNTLMLANKQQSSHGIKHKQEIQDRAVLKYQNHKSFVVYYNTGSAALDANAIYSINRAIEFAQGYDQYRIHVLGFTDRVASRDYNKSLSQKRANEVRKALIERGVPQHVVDIKMFGEDYNSINTRDGVGESFNRRVVIEVDTGGKFDEDTFIMQKSTENVVVE